MRATTLLLLGLIAATPVAAQDPDNPAIVQVGVFNVRQDGSVGGYAVETAERAGEAFASVLSSGPCRMGAGSTAPDQAPPEWAIDAWTIQGRVIDLASDAATIELEWRRVRTSGAATGGFPQSTRLTLPLNQIIPLDAASISTESCGPSSSPATFGARFAARHPAGARIPSGGGRGGRAGGAANISTGVSGGGGGTRQGGGGSATAQGAGGAVGSTVTGRSAGGARSVVRGSAPATSVPPYSAELWLVHRAPGQPDVVSPLAVPVLEGSTPFTFATVQFDAPGGTMHVTVSGSVRIVPGSGSRRLLLFEASRAVTFTPSDQPARDPTPDVERLNATTSLPGPADVVAYEMPELEVPGGPAVPDTISIRLRLKPLTAE